MTTTTDTTYARLVAALARAREQRLIPFASTPTAPSVDGAYLIYEDRVTANNPEDGSYHVYVRDDFLEQPRRIYLGCTCQAGYYGNHPCKHEALVLHEHGLLDEAYAYRTLNDIEVYWIKHGRLPDDSE